MKKSNYFILIVLTAVACVLIIFSPQSKAGAYDGMVLAQNTILPSLTPILIIFYIIIKSNARDIISKLFGGVCEKVFNLPQTVCSVILFGMIGGYPTGALMTNELLISGDIDKKQARRMLRFNFCGGCGFVITAVGSSMLSNTKAGLILLFSNILSEIIIGLALSFSEKRSRQEYFSFSEKREFSDVLSESVNDAVKAVLTMTAYISLFSAILKIVNMPTELMPLFEITNGLTNINNNALPIISAYLAFGGLCIHLQLLPIILNAGMRYYDFLLFRIISSVISFFCCKLLLHIFPIHTSVFSNISNPVVDFTSVNLSLSILMVIGCFVMVFDINSRKKI